MQKIIEIVGLRQEGKSVELMTDFISASKMFLDKTINIRPVFITINATINDGFYNLLELVVKSSDDLDVGECELMLNADHKIFEVGTLADLYLTMSKCVEEEDVVFFIDDLDYLSGSGLDPFSWLRDFMDSYPNTQYQNSCDIIYTRTRGKGITPACWFYKNDVGEIVSAPTLDGIVKIVKDNNLPTTTEIFLKAESGNVIKAPNPFAL